MLGFSVRAHARPFMVLLRWPKRRLDCHFLWVVLLSTTPWLWVVVPPASLSFGLLRVSVLVVYLCKWHQLVRCFLHDLLEPTAFTARSESAK